MTLFVKFKEWGKSLILLSHYFITVKIKVISLLLSFRTSQILNRFQFSVFLRLYSMIYSRQLRIQVREIVK